MGGQGGARQNRGLPQALPRNPPWGGTLHAPGAPGEKCGRGQGSQGQSWQRLGGKGGPATAREPQAGQRSLTSPLRTGLCPRNSGGLRPGVLPTELLDPYNLGIDRWSD